MKGTMISITAETRVRATVMLLVALFAVGCGGDSPTTARGVTFRGNVVSAARAALSPSSGANRLLARFFSIPWWSGPAVAQAACSGDLENVLVCARTIAGGQGCSDSRPLDSCRPVEAGSCTFAVSVEIDPDCAVEGRSFAAPFFVQDTDRDGVHDAEEPDTASLAFTCDSESSDDCVSCNGDLFEFSDVTVDFTTREADARSVQKVVNACPPRGTPSPEPTATPAPTPTPFLPLL